MQHLSQVTTHRRRAAVEGAPDLEDPAVPSDWGRRSGAARVARPSNDNQAQWMAGSTDLRESRVRFDPERRVLWQFMKPLGRPSFTEGLVNELSAALDMVERACDAAGGDDAAPIRYMVLASDLPGVFNLGGNLAMMSELIERGDRDRLRRYAHVSVDVQYRRASGLGRPLTSIALVQGEALGGGFEAALAHDVIVAERSATFALPEGLFNMFAAMGAYNFLARRMDPFRAERLILSGTRCTADELHAMGVVDHVVDDGTGVAAVEALMADMDRRWNARRSMQEARRRVHPVTRDELLTVVDLWVDAALRLDADDLRRMRRIAKAQDRRWTRMAH